MILSNDSNMGTVCGPKTYKFNAIYLHVLILLQHVLYLLKKLLLQTISHIVTVLLKRSQLYQHQKSYSNEGVKNDASTTSLKSTLALCDLEL